MHEITKAHGLGGITLALSIKQPWAWTILNAGKDIENRSRRTSYRGRFLIHASLLMSQDEYGDCRHFVCTIRGKQIEPLFPGRSGLKFGGIVGEATLVDCVKTSDSPWFCGPYGWVLEDVRPLPFMPCKGQVGFFLP